MKSYLVIISMVIIAVLPVISCKTQEKVDKKIELTNVADSASYALGMQIGNNLAQQGLDKKMNLDLILAGLKDVVNGESLLELDNTDALLQGFFAEIQKEESSGKITEGEKFLKENAKKEGVNVTASGLQYEVLVQGNGPKPKATSTVKTHYKGTLLDGRVFDSSYDRGEPTSFPLNRVISGWTEGIQLMNVGSKFRFYIPYNLAYGERGAGQLIGPFETLIFEVELLDIEN